MIYLSPVFFASIENLALGTLPVPLLAVAAQVRHVRRQAKLLPCSYQSHDARALTIPPYPACLLCRVDRKQKHSGRLHGWCSQAAPFQHLAGGACGAVPGLR